MYVRPSFCLRVNSPFISEDKLTVLCARAANASSKIREGYSEMSKTRPASSFLFFFLFYFILFYFFWVFYWILSRIVQLVNLIIVD